MGETNNNYKTLKLKYGEYYSLKITDSGKNVINNVEITGNQITTEQKVFSEPTYTSFSSENEGRLTELMNGEVRLQELRAKSDSEEGLTEEETSELKDLEEEFLGWTYERIENVDVFKDQTLLFSSPQYTPDRDEEVPKHDLKCEIQVVERRPETELVDVPIIVRIPVKFFGITLWHYDKQIGTRKEERKTGNWIETYRWADEYTIPRIYKETLTSAEYNIELNNRLLNTALSANKDPNEPKRFEILNWRYKLTGGQIKIEKLQKEVIMDEESCNLRGKNSYSYPESTLIEASADVNGVNIIKHIGDHILEQYKDGRETMEMTWQGDPTMTLGDRIVIEDKLGIEREFMITGNEFVLENSGKFYMRTEGISVIAG